MGIGAVILMVVCVAAAIYVIVTGYSGLVRLAVSLFRLSGYAETLHNSPHERMVDSESAMPVSVILPDCDSDAGITQTVSDILASDFPEFEVIAMCHPSEEGHHEAGALSRLQRTFNLVEVRQPVKKSVPMAEVSKIYRSTDYPNLVVVEKPAGGRHDDLNTGVNVSRYPLILTLQPGTRIVGGALARIAQPFMLSFSVDAVGGLPRIEEPVQGFLASLQQVEYLQTFPAGFAVPGQGKLPLVPGVFGAFRKKTVIEEGGFVAGANETGMVVQLFRNRRGEQQSDVQLLIEPVYQAVAPKGSGGLFKQRRSWQKQMQSTLWQNIGMAFNPKYGRNGMLDIPLHWLFDIIGPVLELLGCIAVPVAFALGIISPALFWAFIGAEVLLRMVVMLAAVMAQQIIDSNVPSTSRLLHMVGFALLGSIGYHQIILLFKVIAMFTPNVDE